MFDAFAPALGEAFAAAARRAARSLYGFAEHELTSTFLGTSTGLRLRHDQPTGQLELNAKSADRRGSAWAGRRHPRLHRRRRAPRWPPSSRGGWAGPSGASTCRAGRYETLLPPGAVADLMIYLYWSAGAQDAHDGRTVFSAPGGGTRVGERLAEPARSRCRSDPAAPGPGVRAVRGRARLRPATSSVFDNGLPLRPTDWIRDGELARAAADPPLGRGSPGCPSRPASTT